MRPRRPAPNEMKVLVRILLLIAGAAFAGGLILGSLSTRVRPAVLGPPAGSAMVDCGTVFSDTEWSSDHACEGPRIGRAGLMVMAFLVAFPAFLGSVGVLVVTVRRGP